MGLIAVYVLLIFVVDFTIRDYVVDYTLRTTPFN